MLQVTFFSVLECPAKHHEVRLQPLPPPPPVRQGSNLVFHLLLNISLQLQVQGSFGLKPQQIPQRNICKISPVCDYFSRLRAGTGGYYLSMIWVGTCHWDLKSRPIFIPNFDGNLDPFLYQSHKFQAKFTTSFTQLLSFQANFGNFGIRVMKLMGLFSRIF